MIIANKEAELRILITFSQRLLLELFKIYEGSDLTLEQILKNIVATHIMNQKNKKSGLK